VIHQFSIVKIRWIFGLFLTALVVPAAFLSEQAHRQLDWQIMQQYQQDAKSLVSQIDSRLQLIISKEENRSDSDYSFFILTGDAESRLVQRSSLSKFPIESELEGVLGYFQIDQQGLFSSPLLPTTHVQQSVKSQLYGISAEQKKQRKALEKQLKSILLNNKLVSNNTTRVASSNARLEKTIAPQATQLANQDNREFDYQQGKQAAEQLAKEDAKKGEKKRLEQKTKQRYLVQSKRAKRSKRQENLFETALAIKKTDRGKRVTVSRSNSKPTRKNRTETYFKSPNPVSSLQTNTAQALTTSEPELRAVTSPISLFSSELEPFKIALLESDHLVAYRQVWRNDKLLIQGAIIDSQLFIEKSLASFFYPSQLSSVSQMDIYFGKRLLSSLSSSEQAATRDHLMSARLSEPKLLFQAHLSDPFNQLELMLHLTRLPQSGSAYFIEMVTIILFLVLILGTFFLYRVTIKQAQLAQQQQDFVSSVSHELKTPLTSIRMYGEILKQGWASEQKRQEYYDFIYAESERLARLISNVLQIAKVSHNALDLNLEWVEIKALKSLLQSKLLSQVEQNQFQLDLSFEPALENCSLYLDSDAFVQIMINLVDNSLKYAAKAQQKIIKIHFKGPSKKGVQVSVRDFGPGIEEKQLKSIFQLFYRSGNELTRETSGTGIGLALVKEFITAMSAKIEAINHKTGVEFCMTFQRFELNIQ